MLKVLLLNDNVCAAAISLVNAIVPVPLGIVCVFKVPVMVIPSDVVSIFFELS